jgi:hypothetical protein
MKFWVTAILIPEKMATKLSLVEKRKVAAWIDMHQVFQTKVLSAEQTR